MPPPPSPPPFSPEEGFSPQPLDISSSFSLEGRPPRIKGFPPPPALSIESPPDPGTASIWKLFFSPDGTGPFFLTYPVPFFFSLTKDVLPNFFFSGLFLVFFVFSGEGRFFGGAGIWELSGPSPPNSSCLDQNFFFQRSEERVVSSPRTPLPELPPPGCATSFFDQGLCLRQAPPPREYVHSFFCPGRPFSRDGP